MRLRNARCVVLGKGTRTKWCRKLCRITTDRWDKVSTAQVPQGPASYWQVVAVFILFCHPAISSCRLIIATLDSLWMCLPHWCWGNPMVVGGCHQLNGLLFLLAQASEDRDVAMGLFEVVSRWRGLGTKMASRSGKASISPRICLAFLTQLTCSQLPTYL